MVTLPCLINMYRYIRMDATFCETIDRNKKTLSCKPGSYQNGHQPM